MTLAGAGVGLAAGCTGLAARGARVVEDRLMAMSSPLADV
jgi:hypothetical protein